MKLSNKIKLGLVGVTLMFGIGINTVNASINKNLPKSSVSDTFPKSYQTYIDNLKKSYPNAVFKAVYTGLDWDTVLKHESYEVKSGISLVPSSYDNVWKKDGKNIYKDGNFVVASKSAVAYVLDPRNSLYEKYIFQFEGLTYNNLITTSVIEKVISSSPMVGTYAKKYKNAGNWCDMDMSYAEIINEVGSKLNVSSVYIASRMIQETSGDIVNNGSINGNNSKYPGVYNFFNIGATPDKNGDNSVTNGLKYASSKGWTTPYLSIYGGVDEISSSYIKYGQDTVYFQKFDVNNPYGNAVALMAYQYQTNILAPRSESLISYNAYKKLDMLDTSFTFYIPVYNNMPEDATPYPAGDSAKFTLDNTKVYLDDNIKNGTDAFNIRSSASSELDNIIYTVTETKEGSENRTIMTRTKKGDGYNWDYVEFTVNGENIKGYVWSEYVNDYDYTKVQGVTLNKEDITLEIGESFTLVSSINPTNAKFKDIVWTVDEGSVIDLNEGVITAKSEGTAIVTATTVDQEKTATCKVTVTKQTTKIETDSEEYTVTLNKYITPNITVKNDTGYTLEILDEEVAKIEEGRVLGLKEGSTTLKIVSDNKKVTKEVKITVCKEYIEFDTSLNVKDNIITNIETETKVSEILNKITTTYTVEIINIKDEILDNDNIVGTGTKINFKNVNGDIVYTYTLLIYGDVDGDGEILASDYVIIKNHIMNDGGITGIKIKAADVNGDGEILANDYVVIKNHIMNDGGIIVQK